MKKSNRQLSLRGLRTFCVAARHKSFTTAAQELFVTASAISHQIKSLEEEMGITLFARTKRSLELTATGQSLYDQVAPLIRELDDVTATFLSRSNRFTLRLSVQPFFASELFVSRLSEFTARHPDIDIHIDTSDESPEKHPKSADVSIRLFRSAPTGLASDPLFPLSVVPACSPELHEQITGQSKSKRGKPNTEFPLVVHASRVSDWQTWCDTAGVPMPESSNIVHLNSMVAVVGAAQEGLGVAMVPMPLCKRRFDDGKLVRLYDTEVPTGDRYYVVYREDAASDPAVRAFRQWVLGRFPDESTA
ncbi:MAG: LysR substrate-binding domain-containing protein [Pseudomonadota bacterium]